MLLLLLLLFNNNYDNNDNNNNNNAVTKILGYLYHILECDFCPKQHYFNFWPDSLLRKKLSEQLQVSNSELFMKGILRF